MRTGIANLPLHGGKCPRWLFERMVGLARALINAMVNDCGPESVLIRLSDPFWFQSFGCALGFDWHSSGLTTTVCGALKESLKGLENETGIVVAGGKGKTSRRTPEEILVSSERLALRINPEDLVYASKMSAKVDSAAVQDGFQLYHHTFIFTLQGNWAVIQQGMNERNRLARRYHWLSDTLQSFVCEPHHAVCCDSRTQTLNLVAKESEPARKIITSLSREKPEKLVRDLSLLQEKAILTLPQRHQVELKDIHPKSLERVLLKSYERQPESFAALLNTAGVGAKALRALSLLSELAFGAPPSYRDPAKYSFAHGGKDGYPYPVDQGLYDRNIDFLNKAIEESRLGRQEKIEAFKRLHNIKRHLVRGVSSPEKPV